MGRTPPKRVLHAGVGPLQMVAMPSPNHNLKSSQREAVLEHLLLGEILRVLWLKDISVEVLHPQVDDAGYDVVLESNGVVRHIQIKTSFSGATTNSWKVRLELAGKPSGCVVCVIFDQTTLQFERFLWFGNRPREPLPDIETFRVGKHTKANSKGVKAKRDSTRVIPKAAFTRLDSIEDIVQRLFGF